MMFSASLNASCRQWHVVGIAGMTFNASLIAPLGLHLFSQARDCLQARIGADRAIRRVATFSAGLSPEIVTNLVAKLKPLDCVGSRFSRAASSLKESILEKKTIMAAVGEAALAGNTEYMEAQTALQTAVDEVAALDSQKFIKALFKSLEECAKATSSPSSPGGGKLFKPKALADCQKAFASLVKNLNEMSWKGLTMTDEMDEVAEKLRVRRIAFVIGALPWKSNAPCTK
jgi:hypothetical protein